MNVYRRLTGRCIILSNEEVQMHFLINLKNRELIWKKEKSPYSTDASVSFDLNKPLILPNAGLLFSVSEGFSEWVMRPPT